MIAYTVPEIRRLLVHLILRQALPMSTPGPGHTGDDAYNTRPDPAITEPADTSH
ncbi:hypothetical protein R1X32_01740 (plasmid) [Rhodococcus opacus]|nr:hypothetical protein HJ581_0047530 [Rhodococcus opacus]